MAATSGRPSMLDPDTFTSPESYEVALLAAGAAVQAAEHALDARGEPRVRAGAPAGASRRARQGDGLLPVQQRRGRRGRGASRADCRASRSSTSTSTTATARSGFSTTTRASFTCRRTSSRSIPGPARPTRSGPARARASRSTSRWPPARPTPTTTLVYAAIVDRLRRVRAGAAPRLGRLRRARATTRWRRCGVTDGRLRGHRALR